MSNIVFIATSLDGYIAGKNNEVDWLESIPNPENLDMGFSNHMQNIDALVMGRNTMELVVNMGVDWPYNKPVFVLSNTLTHAPKGLENKVYPVNGDLKSIVKNLNQQGYNKLYIDGGLTIQSFLKQGLIDEMIITTIPILLGDGIPLFGNLNAPIEFRCIRSECYSNGIAQNHYRKYINNESVD